MDQVAPETTAATTPAQIRTNPIATHTDLFPGHTVKNKRVPPLDLAAPSSIQATTHLSPRGPTVIHIEHMGHSGAAPEPMTQQGCKVDARQLSSDNPRVAVVPTRSGPDSACVLMTPERPSSKPTAADPEHRCCGGHTRLIARYCGKEREISRLLGNPNLPRNREHKLTLANPANMATDGAGVSSSHTETRQQCCGHTKNCLHVRQFSRILPADEFNWAGDSDVSGFFLFPPTDLANMDQAMKEAEAAEINPDDKTTTFQGLETELDNFLDGYTQDSQAFGRFFALSNAEVKKLRDDRSVTAQTLSQLEANTQSLFDGIRNRPGGEIPQVHRDTLRSAIVMKTKLDARLKDIEQKLKAKTTLANEVLEQALFADFCPFKLIEDQRRCAQEAELLQEQQEWTIGMTALWRIQQGSSNFQKSAWRWHDVKGDDIYPKLMPTYPTGPVTATRPSPALSRTPSNNQQEIKIPPWFTVLEASGRVELEGKTPEARYQTLVSVLVDPEGENLEAPVERDTFKKNWHEPKSGWPYPSWRRKGGWWSCRSGPDASKEEQECSICHKAASPQVKSGQPRSRPGPSARRPTGKTSKDEAKDETKDEIKVRIKVDSTPPLSRGEIHKKLLAEIERAMNKCNEKGRMELRARMERQRQANEGSDRARDRLGQNAKQDNLIRILVASPPDGQAHHEIFCYGGARLKK